MRRSSSQILADWREQLWSTYVRLESLSDAEDFYGSVSTVLPGCSRISVVNSTAQITERTSSNVRSDPREYLLLAFQRSGHGFANRMIAARKPGPAISSCTTRFDPIASHRVLSSTWFSGCRRTCWNAASPAFAT